MTKFIFYLQQFRVLLLVLLCALFTLPLSAQKLAYVVRSSDNTTLTFYYDDIGASRGEAIWGIYEEDILPLFGTAPKWLGKYPSSEKVTKVVFDSSFKDFRPKTTSCWFVKLSALSTIEGIENLNTSEVTDMSYMFCDCRGLMELDLSNFNTAKVKNMESMFLDCYDLKELNVSSFNTAKVTNMHQMFNGCSGLKELNLSSFNTSAVTDMNQMFLDCSGLKELNVSSFNTSKVTNMGRMFAYCDSLSELNLSNFNSSAVTAKSRMFEHCISLKTIYSSDTWKDFASDMFVGCTQLKGAVKFDAHKVGVEMANPETGYFTKKLPSAIGRVVYGDNAMQIYNLQGKCVGDNQRHLPAGFYIVNGKKVYLDVKP